MANKTCRPLNDSELEKVIITIRNGYKDKMGVTHRPNKEIAMAIWLEANIGLRISDIKNLKLSNFFKKNVNDYYLSIVEKKTGKRKELYCPTIIYDYIVNYCLDNNINTKQPIIKCSVRNVQKHIKFCREYLDLGDNISTHSMRKRFATKVYEQSDYDLLLLQSILLHSSPDITKRYVGLNTIRQKEILDTTIKII